MKRMTHSFNYSLPRILVAWPITLKFPPSALKWPTLQTQTLYSSQGTPCESIPTGKNLFSLQGTPVLIAGSLFSLQGFPCKPLYFPVRHCSVPKKDWSSIRGAFHLCLFFFDFPFIYNSKRSVQESFHNQFKLFWYGFLFKTWPLFFASIYFEVPQNDNWTESIWASFLVQQQLELVNESQLKEVQIKQPRIWIRQTAGKFMDEILSS